MLPARKKGKEIPEPSCKELLNAFYEKNYHSLPSEQAM